MTTEEIKSTPKPTNPSKGSVSIENGGNRDTVFSPRFRSAAAMAGWDEEALLLATLVVEDTPERESKQKKKINLHFKTPPVSSRRKRRVHRQSPTSKIPIVVLNLDEEETVVKGNDRKKMEPTSVANKEKEKEGRNALPADQNSSCDSSVPCIDRLKEELSCAICLDICFEPSTTPCGHSFCKQCLKSAADKCGKKCPKCRQLISNGRYCTVNTVLWNTIQLLFPQEVEAKKASRATNSSPECNPCPSPRKVIDSLRRNLSPLSPPGLPLSRQLSARRRRAAVPSQSVDAALALRLQREEFMEVFRGSNDEQPRAAAAAAPISSARANIRAMASRAMNLRIRERFR